MQRNGRGFRFAIAVMIALLFCAQVSYLPCAPVAYAEAVVALENSLKIEVALKPEELAAPREVTLSFTLTNQSELSYRNINLTSPDGLISEPIGQLSSGESQVFNRMHSVTQSEWEAGVISYIITCDTDAGRLSFPANAYIQKNSMQPQVEFTRQISNTYVTEDRNVVVVYRIENTGNVEVNTLSLNDPLGDFVGRIETLDVGESKTFTSRVNITDTAVSSPVLTYASGPEKENTYSLRLEDQTIFAAFSSINIMLAAQRSVFESGTAEVSLTMLNMGDIGYTDLTVYDDIYGGVIADSMELPVSGKPIEVKYTYPIRENRKFRWRVTGSNAAGDRIDFVTNTAAVAEADEPGEILLTIKATTPMPQINRKGYVPFTFEITNEGSKIATNVKLYEETLGELSTLAVVPPGEPTVHTFQTEVRQDTNFVFSISYNDQDGTLHTATADPIEVILTSSGQSPLEPPNRQSLFEGISVQVDGSSIYVWLIVAASIVLVILCLILILTSRRERKERKERIAAKKQRAMDELAKTNRFKPIKLPKNKK